MKRLRKKIVAKRSLIALLLLLSFATYLFKQDQLNTTVEASSIVTKGDFKLNAENKWDALAKKNYASLNWDAVPDLSQEGYQLYQSEDGVSWKTRSLKYGKAIKVLNVFPDIEASNTLAGWMNGLGLKDVAGSNLIQVTPVSISDFNANPNLYLKNTSGDYQYDVIMFGSWDSNNSKLLSSEAITATELFIQSGRGALFGHDTIKGNSDTWNAFSSYAGIAPQKPSLSEITGSINVKIVNNGYLLKYPFELQDNLVLTIPYAHNTQLSIKKIGTVWMEFINPSGRWPNPVYDNGILRGGFYLKTNNNLAMIQTGHSNGASTPDEQKIIANTLYNLAQVSLDTSANDQTVKDDQAPNLATANQLVGGTIENFDIQIDSVDKGKEYQWYVEANTKTNGVKKSDIVKEEITSNIAGYFYTIDSSPSSALNTTVEGHKDSFGRIDASKYDLYVAPTGTTDQTAPNYDPAKDANRVSYNTKGTITGINGMTDKEQYIHIVSVDRANNVSGVKTIQIKDLMTTFRVTEQYQYQDADGQLQDLKPATIAEIREGTNYSKLAPTMPDNWEATAYKVDNGAVVQGTTAKIDNVKNHHTVTFIYKKATSTVHVRQVILSAEPSLIVPSSGYVDFLQQDTLIRAKSSSGIKADLAFTPINLEMLTGYYTYQINPIIPEYYQYMGYLVTDKVHTTGVSTADGTLPVLDFKVQKEYWVTIYLEPIATSPKPYSWTYQAEKFKELH